MTNETNEAIRFSFTQTITHTFKAKILLENEDMLIWVVIGGGRENTNERAFCRLKAQPTKMYYATYDDFKWRPSKTEVKEKFAIKIYERSYQSIQGF